MNEDATAFFIMGMMLGCFIMLIVQSYGRRKVKQAVAQQPDADRAVVLLSNENERQMTLISRLEERIGVMERIATDPAERTIREIERLR